mgnify:CR=1 FL=1
MNRLSLSRRFVIGGLGLTALSACTGTQYNRPAGSEIDEGAFGDSTMQNMLVMNGEAPALSHLGTRFAAEVPTTINFAFNSSALDATGPAGSVHPHFPRGAVQCLRPYRQGRLERL